MTDRHRRIIQIISAALAAGLLSTVLWQWWTIASDNRERLEGARLHASQVADSAQAAIEGTLQRVAKSVDGLADELLTKDEVSLRSKLRSLLYSDPGYVEAGIAFAPFAYDPRIRLFGLALKVDERGISAVDLDVNQDYTKKHAQWYHRPMAGRASWMDPVYDKETQQTRVIYAAPVYQHAESRPSVPVGVVYARYNVSAFDQVLNGLDLGQNGYAYLLSGDGHYLVHPNRDLIGRQPHYAFAVEQDPATTSSRKAIHDASRTPKLAALGTESGTRVLNRSLDPPGWTLGITLSDQDFLADPQSRRRAMIWLMLTLGLAIFLAAVTVSRVTENPGTGLWVLSWVFAAICVGLYWLVIRTSFTSVELDSDGQLIVTRQYALNEFMSRQTRRTLDQRGEIPLFIPTGIYVQSLNFTGPTDLRVTGYVWQRYTDGVHDEVERGFVMPESSSFELEKSYATRLGRHEVIGWNFKATLSEALEYSGYPFGNETVSIQLWHKQFYRNVILVPDLAAYKNTRPHARPGLVEGLSVPGWDTRRSFFSYRDQSYAANFGLQDYGGLTDFPELYFNMSLKKQIIGPLVSNILPLTVVMILLFAILVLGSSKGRERRPGVALDAVAAGGGLFLLVIFSHMGLRANLAAKEIFYLEYYYFLVYVVILAVTVNYLVFTKTTLWLVQYRDNLIAKSLYWPLTQLAILVLTMAAFY